MGPRVFALVSSLWATCALGIFALGGTDWLARGLEAPVELAVRTATGRAPELDPRLKIFNFDDSTYASLRSPYLPGETWARIVRTLVAAKPRAIVTTHMFGGGELSEANGALRVELERARAAGVRVVGGAFAYPAAIAARTSLPLEAVTFATPKDAPARDLSGWHVYGPDPADVGRFARLGHQGYEGDGRIALLARLGPGRYLPHVSAAVAATIVAGEGGVALDGRGIALRDDGSVRVDLVSAPRFAERTKSLKALLADAENGTPARYVEAGDVVLLLMDMFTGKVAFVATPQGPTPGGYLVADAVSSVLSGRFLREWGFGPLTGVLAATLGAAAGAFLGDVAFALALAALTLGAALAGNVAFAWAGICLPWGSVAILGAGSALSAYAVRTAQRIGVARRAEMAADREHARLAAIVRTAQMFAHDVRKPFSLLNVALGALKKEANPARAGALLARLQPELARAAQNVEAMIRDLMDIDQEAKLDRREVPVTALVEEALRETLAARQAPELAVQKSFAHTLPMHADHSRMKRVLVNVLDNAVQANGGRGRIWVATRDVVIEARSFVELRFGNDGSFVAPELRGRLFEAFYTSGKANGTGLGLAIAQKVVTAHGGRIRCESEKGKGTEFVMTVPVAEATPQVPGVETETPVAPLVAALRHLAAVDDDPFILDAWEQACAEIGIRCATFASAEAFLAHVAAEPAAFAAIDAVVTDLHMGDGDDGLALARALRAMRPELPIFLSTDAADHEVVLLPGDGITRKIPKGPDGLFLLDAIAVAK